MNKVPLSYSILQYIDRVATPCQLSQILTNNIDNGDKEIILKIYVNYKKYLINFVLGQYHYQKFSLAQDLALFLSILCSRIDKEVIRTDQKNIHKSKNAFHSMSIYKDVKIVL